MHTGTLEVKRGIRSSETGLTDNPRPSSEASSSLKCWAVCAQSCIHKLALRYMHAHLVMYMIKLWTPATTSIPHTTQDLQAFLVSPCASSVAMRIWALISLLFLYCHQLPAGACPTGSCAHKSLCALLCVCLHSLERLQILPVFNRISTWLFLCGNECCTEASLDLLILGRFFFLIVFGGNFSLLTTIPKEEQFYFFLFLLCPCLLCPFCASYMK